MTAPRRLGIGLLLIILGLSAFRPEAPSIAHAQDTQEASNEAAQTADDPTPTPVDTTPPVIAQPGNIVVDAVDASGTVVSYAVPAATDDTGVQVAVGCAPGPGVFPIGTTVVTCRAQDAAGNA